MGFRRSTPPIRCGNVYDMMYESDRCWCNECGQTWKFLGPDKGWFPLPSYEASYGERKSSYA